MRKVDLIAFFVKEDAGRYISKDFTCSLTITSCMVTKDGRMFTWVKLTLFRYCQIYTSFHCRVGVPDHMDDGFSCTILHNNGDQKVRTAAEIALMAECNMKLMVALSIMEECFLPILDPRTGIDIIPSILYNWRWYNLSFSVFWISCAWLTCLIAYLIFPWFCCFTFMKFNTCYLLSHLYCVPLIGLILYIWITRASIL